MTDVFIPQHMIFQVVQLHHEVALSGPLMVSARPKSET